MLAALSLVPLALFEEVRIEATARALIAPSLVIAFPGFLRLRFGPLPFRNGRFGWCAL